MTSDRYALSFSGGKDSTLALDRAVRQGRQVAYLFNIFEGVSGRVRFHGVPARLIAAQAASLGIPLIQESTHADDYETVFLRVLDRLRAKGIAGIIFGNIHLADIRAWYEERVRARGFQHAEPLWGCPGLDLAREVVDRGYVARLVSVDLARTPAEWLGRVLDRALLGEIAVHPDMDPGGERGEYHTFVENGPLFHHPLQVRLGRRIEMEGHGLIDLGDEPTPPPGPRGG
ncbi:MAG: adenosine nucleotide hydrolase [Chloroflexi bacterium]|nr:adenosine nucleotide hydrolase [Chloroflexota bacterium]